MKKTYTLTNSKIKFPRYIESVKSELRKYIKRERKKTLPEGADFWDFDCKFGPNAEEAKAVHVEEIVKCLDQAEAENLESFYVEILAKQAKRTKKPVSREAKE